MESSLVSMVLSPDGDVVAVKTRPLWRRSTGRFDDAWSETSQSGF